MVFDYWTIDQDVLVDNLRNEPRFVAMRQEIEIRLEASYNFV